MAQIQVNNLTFAYDGSADDVFENVTFSIDTNWKLGFIGRNGKGKTTFLNLLLGRYTYHGSITANTAFDYFPYQLSETDPFIKNLASDTWLSTYSELTIKDNVKVYNGQVTYPPLASKYYHFFDIL